MSVKRDYEPGPETYGIHQLFVNNWLTYYNCSSLRTKYYGSRVVTLVTRSREELQNSLATLLPTR